MEAMRKHGEHASVKASRKTFVEACLEATEEVRKNTFVDTGLEGAQAMEVNDEAWKSKVEELFKEIRQKIVKEECEKRDEREKKAKQIEEDKKAVLENKPGTMLKEMVKDVLAEVQDMKADVDQEMEGTEHEMTDGEEQNEKAVKFHKACASEVRKKKE